MNRKEHLLTILAEECCEVGQRVSKALRFTPEEVQPNHHQNPQQQSNAERIAYELTDLFAVAEMLVAEGIIPDFRDINEMRAKWMKVEHYLEYSQKVGTLKGEGE